MRRIALVAGTLIAGSVALDACHRSKPQVAVTPVQPAVNQDSLNAAQARADSIARADEARRAAAMREQARADSIRMAGESAAQREAEARKSILAPVYFDYDKSDVRDDQRAALDAKVTILTANASLRLRIDGNTDNRGSDEYNMALGLRRAVTAKRYLVDHGIGAGRLETVSHGAEQPVCQTSDESCWSQNRRDEFTITAGGEHLAAMGH